MDIRFVKRDVLKEKPDQKHLGFGKYMTDYMFVMDWTKEDGWKDARIVPEGPISLEPACVTLHYAQETFDGRGKDPAVPSGDECEENDQFQRETLHAGVPGGYVRRSGKSAGKGGGRLGSV